MAWYAYCITEQAGLQGNSRARRPFAIESLKGVNDVPVLAYPSGDFAVIVSEHSPSQTLTQQAIVDHARVISECFRTLTVLPFRFGTIFESDEALRRAVRGNRKAFLESVARLRGKSEMHVKILVKDGALQEAIAELPNGVGGEYLRKLRVQATRDRERQTKARALSMQVHKLFSPLEEDAHELFGDVATASAGEAGIDGTGRLAVGTVPGFGSYAAVRDAQPTT